MVYRFGNKIEIRHLIFAIEMQITIRRQRPKESQKAVIIDVKEYVGDIASKIWPVVKFVIHFWDNLTITYGQGHLHLSH